MPRLRPIPVVIAVACAVGVGGAGFKLIPQATEPVRTNIIGPETRVVGVATPDGGNVEVEVKLLTRAQTHSVFAVENSYLEWTETSVELVSPQSSAGLDNDALNDAVAGYVRDRTAGSWKMDTIEIPRLLAGQAGAVTTTRTWRPWGLISNFGGLALFGLLAGAIVYGVIIILGSRLLARRTSPAQPY